MRMISFYRQRSGACPVEAFLDALDSKQARKVAWVLSLVRALARPPTQYFKKIIGTEIWEIRVEFAGNAFRLLGFFDGENLIVLTSGFAKKSQKTPKQEIATAQSRMKDYFKRKG
jgi:phage-related protein